MRHHFKRALLGAVSSATRRHAVLLEGGASSEDGIAAVSAPYRVDGDRLVIRVAERIRGTLTATYRENGEDRWSSPVLVYRGPCPLELDLSNGQVTCAGQPLGSVSNGERITARRFEWRFELAEAAGPLRTRRTGHYVARHGSGGDASYYEGEDYVDYEEESQEVHTSIAQLAAEHGGRGPVLEIGCATGGTLAALRAGGFDGVGLDSSQWAVERAVARLGAGTAFVCDVERDPLPPEVQAMAPFGMLVMASVFEHFSRPFDVLNGMAGVVAPGGLLIAITSNADSLSHRIFGPDWEGYFDWTHHGVDQVTPTAMREQLPKAGWRIRTMHTWHVWDGSSDPTHAALRDWFTADARFRRLLRERDLGDFLTCVAERT